MATTLLNLPPNTPSTNDTSSDPGTPASGISTLSTTAIKDGHEGHHPHVNFDAAAERVARLGGIASPQTNSTLSADNTTPTREYFPDVNVPHTPGTSSIVSTDGQMTPEGETFGANSTQAKRETMAAVLARRNMEQNQALLNNNTTPSVANMIDGMTYDEGDTTGEGLERRNTLRPGEYTGVLQRDEDTPMQD